MHYATRLKNRIKELEAEVKRLSAGTSTTPTDDFADLKVAIADDVVDVNTNIIANTFLNKICMPYNCRENAFVMETGEPVRVQPFRFTDATYSVASRSMIERILRETKVDEIQWQASSYDCEDIARKFVTRCADLGLNSVGRVMSWSGGHAFCVAVVQDGSDIDFMFIEPQTDQIVEVGNGNYDLENALIVVS